MEPGKEMTVFHQPNIVSKAPIQTNSTTALKTVKYALSLLIDSKCLEKYENIDLFDTNNLLPEYWKDFTVSFPLSEMYKKTGMTKGGKQKNAIKTFLDTAIDTEKIIIQKDTKISAFSWFHRADLDLETNVVTFIFQPEIISLLSRNLKYYSILKFSIISKLSSSYAIRFYELIMSFYNMKGKAKYGNLENEWETGLISFSELRRFLCVKPDVYPVAGDFKKNCIDKPLKELNEVLSEKEGIEISVAFEKTGKQFSSCNIKCFTRMSKAEIEKEKDDYQDRSLNFCKTNKDEYERYLKAIRATNPLKPEGVVMMDFYSMKMNEKD